MGTSKICYSRHSTSSAKSLQSQVCETASRSDDIDSQKLVGPYVDGEPLPSSHGKVSRAARATQTDSTMRGHSTYAYQGVSWPVKASLPFCL